MRHSRYMQTTRRTRRQVLVSGAAALFSGVFATRAAQAKVATVPSTPGSAAASCDTAGSTTPAGEASATTVGATTPASSAGSTPTAAGTFPDGQSLTVDFTYMPEDGGGRIHNPFLAVWVEDQQGLLVRTVLVSVQQGKGERWWRDLRSWYGKDQDRIAAGGEDLMSAISSPTREPGAWEGVWDGRNDKGELVALGNYKLFLESARERGPYNIAEYDLVLDGSPIDVRLEPAGELQDITIKFGCA